MNNKILLHMLRDLSGMCDQTKSAFFANNQVFLANAGRIGEKILGDLDTYRKTDANDLSLEAYDVLAEICNLMLRICRNVERKIEQRILFSTKAVLEISHLFTQLRSLFEIADDVIKFSDQFVLDLFIGNQASFDGLHEKFINNHKNRILEGTCLTGGASIYLDILIATRNISMCLTKLVFMEPCISPIKEPTVMESQ